MFKETILFGMSGAMDQNKVRKSKLPEYFRSQADLAAGLAYPLQLLLLQGLSTPFERLQVLRQCEPSLALYRGNVSAESVGFRTAEAKAVQAQTKGYSALLSGGVTRDPGDGKVAAA